MTMRLFLDEIQQRLRDVIRDVCGSYDGANAVADEFSVSIAKPGFGDASSNAAFLLARHMKKSPGQIALLLCDAYNQSLGDTGLVVRAVPHTSGYLNFEARWVLLSDIILRDSHLDTFGMSDLGRGRTVTIEHTSVNPNKALHIGHVRNIIVGDTISRMLAKSGYGVNVLNYVDDSGLQVADVIVGFRHLGFSQEPPAGKSFAQYCGDDVYVKTTRKYESDSDLEQVRRDTLKEIEDASTETAAFADHITRRVLADQLETCWQLSVYYDCLNFESHIIRSGLWGKTFEKLKDMKLVELDSSGGKNNGCWVIRGAHSEHTANDAKQGLHADTESVTVPAATDGGGGNNDVRDHDENLDKVIVRSNGTATYIAKDIPYAAWKLGLLDDPFGYILYEKKQPGRRTLWQTTLEAGDCKSMNFAGERVITVIDSRQSGLQRIVANLMQRFKSDESAYVHLAYESVTLSPDTAKMLGMETHGKQAQMSGRHGLYVDADSVCDMLFKKIARETKKRHPDMADDEICDISRMISVGTIRYEMIKQDLDKIITFDLERSLSLEGDTASYIQYACARASRILERAGRTVPSHDSVMFDLFTSESEVALIRQIGMFETFVYDAAQNLSPKVLARYCHDLAVCFNMFYERNRVLGLGNTDLETARLYLVASFRVAIAKSLDVLGIDAPDVM